MLSRQATPAWAEDYQPAIRANPREAPRISRPTIIHSARLGGRGVHLLSQPEFHAALLALHHPGLFDLHEQRLLSTCAAPHPLGGHKYAAGLELPSVEGTVRVADRLNQLSLHPRLFAHRDGEEGEWVPIPFCGDLLLFLEDDHGPYCVNWNVKKSVSGFRERMPRLWGKQRTSSADPRIEFRHRLEKEYYADAGIRTVQVTEDQINLQLRHNLREIFPWHLRGCALGAARDPIVERLRAFVDTQVIAFDAVRRVASEFGVCTNEVKVALYQAVWARQIEVDLYSPFLFDRPLRMARTSPLVAHSAWFGR